MSENNTNQHLTYISFIGKYDFDKSAELFTGEVSGLRAVITFKNRTLEELEKSFHSSIELFLQILLEDVQLPETQVDNVKSKLNEDEALITIRLTKELIQHLETYKKGGTVEEYVAQLVALDAKQNQITQEVWRAFEEWMPSKIVEVIPLENFSLKVRFEDGVTGEYNMKLSIQRGGVFSALSEFAFFQRVSIGGNGSFIFWPDEIEIGGDTIYTTIMEDMDRKW